MAGMSVTDFWDCQLRDVFNHLRGWQLKEERRMQEGWERTRWQTTVLLGFYMKKGKQLKPIDLVEFPWEEKRNKLENPVVLTEEEKRKRFEKMDRHMKRQAKRKQNGE